jgi:hypothetical protein
MVSDLPSVLDVTRTKDNVSTIEPGGDNGGDEKLEMTQLDNEFTFNTASYLTCEPLVFFPAFAIERRPGLVCLSWKFSSETR